MSVDRTSDDAAAQAAVEGRAPKQDGSALKPTEKPPAGPHADPSLLNPEATPGTGALPPADTEAQGDMDSTSS